MNNFALNKFQNILKTTIFSYVITIFTLLILSLIVYKFDLSEPQAYMGINIIYIISCFVGGFVTGKIQKEKKYMWGLLNAFVYFVILVIISLLVNHSITSSVQSIFSTAAFCLISGSVGGMMS